MNWLKTVTAGIGDFLFDKVYDPWKEMINLFENWNHIQDFLINKWNWNYAASVFVAMLIAVFIFLIAFAIPYIAISLIVQGMRALFKYKK